MPDPLDTLRQQVSIALGAASDAQLRLSRAQARLQHLRASGGEVAEAEAQLRQAAQAMDDSRVRLDRDRLALRDRLGSRIEELSLASIAPADVPLALLPVGLETRFRGDTLLVRIIPDEIHVEEHEPGLTDREVEVGRAFWRRLWRAGRTEPAATEAERGAWTELVDAVGSPTRASWVVERTSPAGERPAVPPPEGETLPEPDFPDPPRRPPQGSRPPQARTLPDRFVAIAYRKDGRGGAATWTEIARATGKPVDDAVQLGLDPGAPPPDLSDDGPAVPPGMRWLLDPQAADDAGLLLRLSLPAGTDRIDRLLVLGVLGSLDAAESAARLSELLGGHRYGRGLGLVPVGTPTNNTRAERSGFGREADAAASFETERRTPAPPDGSDGALLCRALGIPAATLQGVAHGGDREQAAAGRMNALVWPAAMGYWLDSLVQPGPSDAMIDEIRAHALPMVRARGPLPPIRVGRQPYGVLPVTSLASWEPAGDPKGVEQVATYLRRARPWWLDGIGRAPVVRAGANPDQGMLDVLGQLPVSGSVGVRSMVGANASYIPSPLASTVEGPGKTLAGEGNRQRWMALLGLKALGVTGFPYIGQLVGAADPLPELRLPYAVDGRLPPNERAAAWQQVSTYLKGLRRRRTADLKAEDPRDQRSLLGLLARRSVMLERVRAGIRDTHGGIGGRLVEAQVRIDSAAVLSQAMIPTTAMLRIGETRSATATVLAGSVSQPGSAPVQMERYLDLKLVDEALDALRYSGYAETLEAAEAAADLPPERAALLFGEALDVASHRFDAWVTSLATRRLSQLREARPEGVTLGAYGAVEDLARQPARPAVGSPPEGAPSPLLADPSGGGYIHAPSLNQAATAAVLRAGQLAHAARDPGSAALAVDLSSRRVRLALELLDGVRRGQSLGALLGYRAERRLHELGAHTAVEVVRRLAPPPAVTGEGSPEGIAPRAVCDGLALSRMKREDVLGEARRAGVDVASVGQVLDALADQVDAVADLLLAESVHQVVQGNPERAAAALDTLNRGEGGIAEPAVVRTPRSGTTLTQRVLVALGKEVPPAPGWPVDGIRARAEPRLAAWAGHLLGDPTGVSIVVRAPSGASLELGVAELGLGALDLVHESLAPRVLRRARGLGAPEGAQLEMQAPAIARLLAMAELLHGLLGRARAGTGLDLARPQDRGSVVEGPPTAEPNAADAASFTTPLPDVDAGDRRARLDAARARLRQALDALPVLAPGEPAPPESGLAAALDALAAFGIAPGGDPARPPDGAALTALRASAAAALARSIAAPDDAAALFGEGFPVLALAAAPSPAAVAAALARDPIAAAPPERLAPAGGAAQALASWLENQGRVRAPLGRLADVLLAARLQGGDPPMRLQAMQLPPEPFPDAPPAQRGQWIGLPFPAALAAEPVTGFVLHVLGEVDPAAGTALLVVDEFTELVPAEQTTTALSFGFDAPGARPPQSVLLAVPPVPGAPWSIDALAEVVGETLDLAKMRMVDLSAVAWAGRFLPTVYLTDGDVAGGLDLPMKEIVSIAHRRFTEMDR